MRRTVPVAAACIAAALLCSVAQGQNYPAKPLRVVTEFVAGAGGDISLRVILAQLSLQMDQPIVVENQAGGSGIIAAQTVIRAPADGYTLLVETPNAPVVRVHLARSNQIDAARTLTPITLMFETALVLAANSAVPASNLQELIAYAKQNPGKLSYGSNGVGSAPHFAGEQIRMLTGIQIVHVPYKAMQQAMMDAVTGQIPLSFTLAGQIAPFVASGKVKVIAVLNERRYPAWPEVATLKESLPGYEPVPSWTGMWGPAGLPQPVLARLSAELSRAIGNAEVRAKLAAGGTQGVGSTPAEFASLLQRQTDLIGQIVKSANIEAVD